MPGSQLATRLSETLAASRDHGARDTPGDTGRRAPCTTVPETGRLAIVDGRSSGRSSRPGPSAGEGRSVGGRPYRHLTAPPRGGTQ